MTLKITATALKTSAISPTSRANINTSNPLSPITQPPYHSAKIRKSCPQKMQYRSFGSGYP